MPFPTSARRVSARHPRAPPSRARQRARRAPAGGAWRTRPCPTRPTRADDATGPVRCSGAHKAPPKGRRGTSAAGGKRAFAGYASDPHAQAAPARVAPLLVGAARLPRRMPRRRRRTPPARRAAAHRARPTRAGSAATSASPSDACVGSTSAVQTVLERGEGARARVDWGLRLRVLFAYVLGYAQSQRMPPCTRWKKVE